MSKLASRALFICVLVGSIIVSGYVLKSVFFSGILKNNGRALLEQSAVISKPWYSHGLNVTYGEGGGTKSLVHNHTHNKQGFKHAGEVTLERPANVLRIFALGGSTLYGWGSEGLPQYGNWPHLALDETITHFMEKRLQAYLDVKYPGYQAEVINAAVIDHNSAFHLIRYSADIYQYHPDAVVFLDGNNEFYGVAATNTFINYRNTGVNVVNSFNNRGLSFTLYVVARYLARFSDFGRSLQYEMLQKWMKDDGKAQNDIYVLPEIMDGIDAKYAERARIFLRNYVQLKAALQYDNVRYALFLGPQMQHESYDMLNDDDQKTWKQVQEDWGTPDRTVTRRQFMKYVRSVLPGFFETIDFPYYDLGSIADLGVSEKGLYIDYTHVTPTGAEAVGTKMAEEFLPTVDAIIAERAR